MKYIFMVILIFALVSACSNSTPTNERASHTPASANNAAPSPSRDSHADGHGDANHSTDSSPGAASAPFELQFLDSMIAHHKGAVEMATLAETRAERGEIKELAKSIIFDQEREIGKMTEWRDGWFEGKAEAINMQFPGMSRGMQSMDMKKLESLRGREFDTEFVRQMIPHHEGAIEMAKAVRGSTSRAELKEFADDIISAQQTEVGQMRGWQ